MSHIGDLACRTHQVILAEEVAGTHPKLPSHHLFIKAVVACYVDGVDTCLRTSTTRISRAIESLLMLRSIGTILEKR